MDLHLPTHGISWNSIFWRFVKFHGIPCPYCWNSMELRLFMIREIPWNSRRGKLKIHGTPAFHDLWNSMEFQTRRTGNPWNFRFYQCVEIHGFPDLYKWNSIEFQVLSICGDPWIFTWMVWNSMDIQLDYVEIHGIPGLGILWNSMDIQLDYVEFHGFPDCILLTCSE